MSDLISREALLNAMDKRYQYVRKRVPDKLSQGFVQMEKLIKKQPTIEVVPVDRNSIIDEFARKAIERLEEMNCEAWRKDIMAIAEEMKGGAE